MDFHFGKTITERYGHEILRARDVLSLIEYKDYFGGVIASKDFSVHESVLVLPYEEEAVREATKIGAQHPALTHIVLVGIGGQSRGVEAVYRACRTANSPKLIVLDVLDVDRVDKVVQKLSAQPLTNFAVIISSKSGKTVETVVNTRTLLSALEEHFGDISSQVFVISDEETELAQAAKEKGCQTFLMPKMVGGRFSVMSIAGLLPLALLRIPVRDLIGGAREYLDQIRAENTDDAMTHASVLAEEARHDVAVLDFFVFNSRLEHFAHWCRQLYAESLGKGTTQTGRTAPNPLIPTVSTASDLHSVAQLTMRGETRIFTHFMYMPSGDLSIPEHPLGANLKLAGQTYATVSEALRDSVLAAYDTLKLPYSMCTSTTSARDIGTMLTFHMLSVLYGAVLAEVNAFDQGSVETYKTELRGRLGLN